jgi:hypothetical protein
MHNSQFLILYPVSQTGYVSSGSDFLLLPFLSYGSARFASAELRYNSGGLLFNNIAFFRKFHVNEFVAFRPLLSENGNYVEVSAGVDNILDLFGFEIAYSSLSKLGVFLRLKISEF